MRDEQESEFYDLADLNLNLNLETGSIETSWGNLGYWDTPKKSYSKAAESLAIELGRYAALSPNDHIFDVGFGCGDQLFTWKRVFQVDTIAGINLSQSQTQFAIKKLKGTGFPSIRVQQGSACHQIDWHVASDQTNKILALDCLYHFDSKAAFFKQCAMKLSASTDQEVGIYVTDFLFGHSNMTRWQRMVLKVICKLSHIPFENLQTLMAYQKQLAEFGLEITKNRDISAPVMDGFARWVPRFKREYACAQTSRLQLPKIMWIKYLGTAYFLRWLRKHELFEYHLIAIKPIKSMG